MQNSLAALFDLDGVIIDTEPQYTEFWAEVATDFQLPDDDFAARVKGQTLTYIFDNYFPNEEVQDELQKRLYAFEQQMDYPYVEGAVDFLKVLRQANVKTAVVTSSNREKMKNVYAAHPEIKQLFTTIQTSENTPRSKPAPDCYLLAAKHLGFDIKSCVVFEDSINGLRAGRDSGAYVVGLTTSNPEEIIAPFADFVIPDFKALSLNDFFAFAK